MRKQSGHIVHEQFLREQYVDKQQNAKDIAKSLGVAFPTVYKWLELLGIPVRGCGVIGEKHPKYKNGMTSKRYKKMIKKEKCEECGTTEKLGIHHKDGNHGNNVVDNLQVLCASCHGNHHWSTDRAKDRQGTHCIRGHLLEGHNLIPDRVGFKCRTCHNMAVYRYRAKKKALSEQIQPC